MNALHLVPGEAGGLWSYTLGLVSGLLEEAPGEIEPVLLCSREGAPQFRAQPWAADVELMELPVHARSRARRVLAEQTMLPRAAARTRADLLHNLLNTAPALPGLPQVTTVLDLIYKRVPETNSRVNNLAQGVLVPMSVRRSRRVLTISQATKRDLVTLLGADPSAVDVTLCGPGRPPVDDPVPAAELRERFSLGERPLVLTVAAKLPHKNLRRLIEALGRIDLDPAPLLVVPGYATAHEEELRAVGGDRVRFVGWLDEPSLDGLYAAASCVVLPSLVEGFGLPVVEAMQRGRAVACSNVSALAEVAGDAALTFDPLDVDAIAAAVRSLLTDAALRERLAAAGRERVRQFSWRRTAAGTLESYRRALGQ